MEQPDLFGEEAKSTPPPKFECVADVKNHYSGRAEVLVQETPRWDTCVRYPANVPVHIAEVDFEKVECVGYRERGPGRIQLDVHNIKDNDIYRMVERYLEQGYMVVLTVCKHDPHADTFSIYGYKEITLLEEA